MKRQYGLGDWLLSRPFRDAQPAWSRKLFWLVGFPAWLGFGYFGVLESFEHKTLALVFFGVFAAVALVQNYYFFTGGGRSHG